MRDQRDINITLAGNMINPLDGPTRQGPAGQAVHLGAMSEDVCPTQFFHIPTRITEDTVNTPSFNDDTVRPDLVQVVVEG